MTLLKEKENLIRRLKDIEDELNGSKIYDFINGWKPLNKLVYNEHKGKDIITWCEYPGGGEARNCRLSLVQNSPYVFADVKFLYHEITQGAVAYIESSMYLSSPYKNDIHREIWRQIVNITDVRTIYFDKKY